GWSIDARDKTLTPHLVVDEGQDLPPGFYRMARLSAVSITVLDARNWSPTRWRPTRRCRSSREAGRSPRR
ncbi:hypothetical protein DLE01_04230, partial [Streptomyces sp. FT05W]